MAETKELSDYALSVDASTNPKGLIVSVGGHVISDPIILTLEYGSYEVLVEVRRGPLDYDYEPISLVFESNCDLLVTSSISLAVSYVRPCAKAEFHNNLKTFSVTSQRFLHQTILCSSTQPQCPCCDQHSEP